MWTNCIARTISAFAEWQVRVRSAVLALWQWIRQHTAANAFRKELEPSIGWRLISALCRTNDAVEQQRHSSFSPLRSVELTRAVLSLWCICIALFLRTGGY